MTAQCWIDLIFRRTPLSCHNFRALFTLTKGWKESLQSSQSRYRGKQVVMSAQKREWERFSGGTCEPIFGKLRMFMVPATLVKEGERLKLKTLPLFLWLFLVVMFLSLSLCPWAAPAEGLVWHPSCVPKVFLNLPNTFTPSFFQQTMDVLFEGVMKASELFWQVMGHHMRLQSLR